MQAQEQYLPLDDIKLRYEVAGTGPLAVVLLHGWSINLHSWDYLFPVLADEYTVVRYDRRGYGRSEGPVDLSLDPVDLSKLLDHLRVEKAVLLGHSEGGASALRFALAYPDRLEGLILFGAPPPAGFGLPWNGPDAVNRIPGIAIEHGLDSMLTWLYEQPISDGFVEGGKGMQLILDMHELYTGQELLDPKPPANATPPPDISRLNEVEVPTLVITGAMEMPYFQIVSDALAFGIPNAERVIVSGGGHSVMLQEPERFNAEIQRFLASVWER